MNIAKDHSYNKLLLSIFIMLWALVCYRSYSLSLIHDEIGTKWSYILNWNPLPYMGYIDANNHFLNSFLSGLIYKITGSDHPFFLRLPNVLAFPLFYWSVVKIGTYGRAKSLKLLMVLGLALSFFILDFFCLCRGYGLSMAFLAFSLFQIIRFQERRNTKNLNWALFGLLLMCTANLALIPLAVIALAHLTVTIVLRKKTALLIFVAFAAIPLAYLVSYSLHLKSIGKLYLGSDSGFIDVTIRSLSDYYFGVFHWSLTLFLILLAGIVVFSAFREVRSNGFSPTPKLLPALYFTAYLLSILVQAFLLDVNYPEHRSALGLMVLFLLSLPLLLDNLGLKNFGYILIIPVIGLFISHFSLSSHYAYWFDNFDEELILGIAPETLGTPSSTYGEYWSMDNELSRQPHLPTYMFQEAGSPSDTLADYLIKHDSLNPLLRKRYFKIYTDPVSEKTLYERNIPLSRLKTTQNELVLSGNQEYFQIFEKPQTEPELFYVSLQLEDLELLHKCVLVCSAQDSITSELTYYSKLPLLESATLQPDKSMALNISIVVPVFSSAQKTKIYLWNMDTQPTKGIMSVVHYTLE